MRKSDQTSISVWLQVYNAKDNGEYDSWRCGWYFPGENKNGWWFRWWNLWDVWIILGRYHVMTIWLAYTCMNSSNESFKPDFICITSLIIKGMIYNYGGKYKKEEFTLSGLPNLFKKNALFRNKHSLAPLFGLLL